ncbi:MAG: DegT/DnrJ/EryC1/StrS family aminotransferase, partial [Planctomycetota bacterium]|nr:DegT/DnrJ/EryC1/StrS family aminotransferase [Planctomycetota bacterium]
CWGTNAKMNEASAAMGLTSFESLADFVAHNQENFFAYQSGLDGVSGVTLNNYASNEAHNYQYIVLEIDQAEFGLTRDQLLRVLTSENILARRYFFPGCHRMEPYRTLYPEAAEQLPVTDAICHRVLILPTGTQLDANDVSWITNVIRFVKLHADEIRIRIDKSPEESSAHCDPV